MSAWNRAGQGISPALTYPNKRVRFWSKRQAALSTHFPGQGTGPPSVGALMGEVPPP